MVTLPPEIIAYIIELAVPGPSFSAFPMRSANLRAFALVSSVWRKEAQRLLFQHPVVSPHICMPNSQHGLDLYSSWTEDDKIPFAPLHLRVQRGPDTIFTLPRGFGRYFGGLSALSLKAVPVALDMLTSLSCLEFLSLDHAKFWPAHFSPLRPISFPRLTDLSLKNQNQLPHCLRVDQLPALQRLVYDFPRWSGVLDPDGEDAWECLMKIQDQLDFISCISTGDLFNEQAIKYLTPLADKILVDINPSVVFSNLDAFEGSPAVRHVRIGIRSYEPLGEDIGPQYGGYWTVESLEKLVRMAFPALETLIVPSSWKKLPLHEDFQTMVRRRQIILLYEDTLRYGLVESLLSTAFWQHRHGGRVKQGSVAN